MGVIETFLKNLSYQISKMFTERFLKYHEKQSHLIILNYAFSSYKKKQFDCDI